MKPYQLTGYWTIRDRIESVTACMLIKRAAVMYRDGRGAIQVPNEETVFGLLHFSAVSLIPYKETIQRLIDIAFDAALYPECVSEIRKEGGPTDYVTWNQDGPPGGSGL